MFGGGAEEKACVYDCIIAYVCPATPLTRSSAVTDIFPQWAVFNRRKELFLLIWEKNYLLWLFPLQSGTDNTAPWEIWVRLKAFKSSFTALSPPQHFFLFFVIRDKQNLACTHNSLTTGQVSRCGDVPFCCSTRRQKVEADSGFLRWDLLFLRGNRAGLLMWQLAASVCVILIHGGCSDN